METIWVGKEKPKDKVSWWVGLTREEFSAQAKALQESESQRGLKRPGRPLGAIAAWPTHNPAAAARGGRATRTSGTGGRPPLTSAQRGANKTKGVWHSKPRELFDGEAVRKWEPKKR